MYKLVKKEEDTSFFEIYDSQGILIKKENGVKNLLIENLETKFVDFFWTEKKGFDAVFIFRDFITFFSFEIMKQLAFKISTKEKIFEFADNLTNLYPTGRNVWFPFYYGNSVRNGFIKFNLLKGEIDEIISKESTNSEYLFFKNFRIVLERENGNFDVLREGNYLWSSSLSDIGRYNDIFGREQIGKLKIVCPHNNNVIVVAGRAAVCYELSTGKVIWELKNERWPFGNWMIIDGDIGYITGEIGYQSIDLIRGEFILPNVSLKNIQISKKNVLPSGRQMIMHDGLLWHSITDSGISVIAAIAPDSGEYVWYQKVETLGWLHSPKFYLDKMYILSSEGELLIYQKE